MAELSEIVQGLKDNCRSDSETGCECIYCEAVRKIVELDDKLEIAYVQLYIYRTNAVTIRALLAGSAGEK